MRKQDKKVFVYISADMGIDIPEGHIKIFIGGLICATCIDGEKYVAPCSENTKLRCLVETQLHKKSYELRKRRSVNEVNTDCNHV